MTNIHGMDHRAVNALLRERTDDCTLTGCCGQRFIGAGMSGKSVRIEGVPGNALGAYLNGAVITVAGNAQDAVGDTMNAGRSVVHGSIGDAAGYAMRGGEIFVRGDAGYRAGIHMKAYKEKVPLLVIGGTAGSFLGEYQAGGVIIVLGLDAKEKRIVSNFPCTGMHGGQMFLRSDCRDVVFPPQVTARAADDEAKAQLRTLLREYCDIFALDIDAVLDAPFTVVTPDSANPYKQMYVMN